MTNKQHVNYDKLDMGKEDKLHAIQNFITQHDTAWELMSQIKKHVLA